MDTHSERFRVSGAWALVAAGVTGAAAAVLLGFIPPAVGTDRFSFPLSSEAFVGIQLFFFLHHLALAWGLFVVWRSGFAGTGLLTRIGGASSVISMSLLAVLELVSATAANLASSASTVTAILGVYGVLSLLNGVALIVFGIAAARSRRGSGLLRFLPLALGIYVIVPLTPALFGPFVIARLAIGGWMVLFAVLGWALLPDRVSLGRRLGPAARP